MFHEKPSIQGQAHTTSLQHLICPIQLQNKTVFIQETPLSSTSQGTSQPWEPSPTGRSSAEVVQSLLGWSDKLGLFSAHQESSFTFKLIPALSGAKLHRDFLRDLLNLTKASGFGCCEWNALYTGRLHI